MKSQIPLFLANLYKPALWLLGGIFLFLNVSLKWAQVSSYAPEWGGFERNVIWGIQQIMLGRPLYSNPEAAPFGIVQYMPLYYYTVGFLGKLFSINPQEAHSVYFLARFVSFVCCILSSILLVLTTIKFRVNKELAVFLGLIAFFWMDRFAIAARPDSFKGLIFQLLIFVLVQFPERRKRFVFPLVLILAVAGLLTKQDGLVFSGILPLSLLLGRNWKETAIWGGLTIVFNTIILFGIQSFSGNTFFFNVIGGLQNGISFSWFMNAFGGYFPLMAVLFGLALAMAFEFIFESNWKLHVLSSALICSFFPALLSSFKFGSGANYFLESTLISLVLAGIWIQKTNFNSFFVLKGSPRLFGLFVFGLLFYVSAMHWLAGAFLNSEPLLKSQYMEQKMVADYLLGQNAGKAKVLVCIDKQWEESLTTLLPENVVSPQRDVAMQVFKANGKISFKPLSRALINGEIQFVVTDIGRKPAFLNFDFSSFSEDFKTGNYQVWKNRKI
jgi:hypothetical protein